MHVHIEEEEEKKKIVTLIVLSWLALTTLLPSPKNLAASTLLECPVNVCRSLWSSMLHTLAAKSDDAPRMSEPLESWSSPSIDPFDPVN